MQITFPWEFTGHEWEILNLHPSHTPKFSTDQFVTTQLGLDVVRFFMDLRTEFPPLARPGTGHLGAWCSRSLGLRFQGGGV